MAFDKKMYDYYVKAEKEARDAGELDRANSYLQSIKDMEYEGYEAYKSQDAKDKQGKKAGGKVMRANMEKQMKYRKGGMTSCGSKKKMAAGGKVRGCGAAKRGVKKAKMY